MSGRVATVAAAGRFCQARVAAVTCYSESEANRHRSGHRRRASRWLLRRVVYADGWPPAARPLSRSALPVPRDGYRFRVTAAAGKCPGMYSRSAIIGTENKNPRRSHEFAYLTSTADLTPSRNPQGRSLLDQYNTHPPESGLPARSREAAPGSHRTPPRTVRKVSVWRPPVWDDNPHRVEASAWPQVRCWVAATRPNNVPLTHWTNRVNADRPQTWRDGKRWLLSRAGRAAFPDAWVPAGKHNHSRVLNKSGRPSRGRPPKKHPRRPDLWPGTGAADLQPHERGAHPRL